jgi:SpoVK/Ycf46/Vps4 family AAA+-type ATPase
MAARRASEWTDFVASEPFSGGDTGSPYNVFERLDEDFVKPRVAASSSTKYFSMLLYGPPGTGKSTVAEEVANALSRDWVRVTPSDFLTAGGEHVEARATAIFTDVLPDQANLFVLFDEIDQLLLDRNSRLYRAQGDVFKMLTPGMLTKINDLARGKQVVFAIATNYIERIDRAIRRAGRIDASYLVLPPDFSRRLAILAGFDDKRIEGWPSVWKQLKASSDELARHTACFAYGELEQLARQIVGKAEGVKGKALKDLALREALLIQPVRPEDYLKTRMTDDEAHRDAVDKPSEEFALMCYLRLEKNKTVVLSDEAWRALECVVNPGPGIASPIRDPAVRTALESRVAEWKKSSG